MALERNRSQIQLTFVKAIARTEVYRKNCLKWAQDNKATNWEQMVFAEETITRLNTVKRLVWNIRAK